MLLKLPSRDIQPRQEIIIPGAWCGEAMDVTLDGDRRGRLEATMQVDPNTWHLRWQCPNSQLHGRTFELAKMISDIHPPSRQANSWKCRLMLVDDGEAAQMAKRVI